jgi:hypothetical protein
MRKKCCVALFFLTGLIAMACPWVLGEAVEITAKGYGTIYGTDKSAARDRAIEDAQRKAVEQAMGTMISSESVTQNFQLIEDRILSLSSGYIETYRIIHETELDGEIEIEIAAIVGMEKLNDSLQAIQNLIRRVDKPKIMLLIAEQSILQEGSIESKSSKTTTSLSATSLGVVENTLIEFFRSKGFQFVDRQALAGQIDVADPFTLVNDQERIQSIANLTDAQVVIFGQAQARTSGNVEGIFSGQANIALRALKTDSGEIIAASSAHAASPHVDPSTANTKALSDASHQISQQLMDQILKQWQAETSGTRTIALIIKGVSYAELKKFRDWLPQFVRGVKGIYQRSVRNNTAELDIDLQGSAQNLADELSEKQFNNRAIEVMDLLPNKISIELK